MYFVIYDRCIHAGPIYFRLIQQVTEQQRRRQRGRDTVLYITTKNLHNQTLRTYRYDAIVVDVRVDRCGEEKKTTIS
jgi:hypothetical protein